MPLEGVRYVRGQDDSTGRRHLPDYEVTVRGFTAEAVEAVGGDPTVFSRLDALEYSGHAGAVVRVGCP